MVRKLTRQMELAWHPFPTRDGRVTLAAKASGVSTSWRSGVLEAREMPSGMSVQSRAHLVSLVWIAVAPTAGWQQPASMDSIATCPSVPMQNTTRGRHMMASVNAERKAARRCFGAVRRIRCAWYPIAAGRASGWRLVLDYPHARFISVPHLLRVGCRGTLRRGHAAQQIATPRHPAISARRPVLHRSSHRGRGRRIPLTRAMVVGRDKYAEAARSNRLWRCLRSCAAPPGPSGCLSGVRILVAQRRDRRHRTPWPLAISRSPRETRMPGCCRCYRRRRPSLRCRGKLGSRCGAACCCSLLLLGSRQPPHSHHRRHRPSTGDLLEGSGGGKREPAHRCRSGTVYEPATGDRRRAGGWRTILRGEHRSLYHRCAAARGDPRTDAVCDRAILRPSGFGCRAGRACVTPAARCWGAVLRVGGGRVPRSTCTSA